MRATVRRGRSLTPPWSHRPPGSAREGPAGTARRPSARTGSGSGQPTQPQPGWAVQRRQVVAPEAPTCTCTPARPQTPGARRASPPRPVTARRPRPPAGGPGAARGARSADRVRPSPGRGPAGAGPGSAGRRRALARTSGPDQHLVGAHRRRAGAACRPARAASRPARRATCRLTSTTRSGSLGQPVRDVGVRPGGPPRRPRARPAGRRRCGARHPGSTSSGRPWRRRPGRCSTRPPRPGPRSAAMPRPPPPTTATSAPASERRDEGAEPASSEPPSRRAAPGPGPSRTSRAPARSSRSSSCAPRRPAPPAGPRRRPAGPVDGARSSRAQQVPVGGRQALEQDGAGAAPHLQAARSPHGPGHPGPPPPALRPPVRPSHAGSLPAAAPGACGGVHRGRRRGHGATRPAGAATSCGGGRRSLDLLPLPDLDVRRDEVDPRVLVVTLDDPERRNVMAAQMTASWVRLTTAPGPERGRSGRSC